MSFFRTHFDCPNYFTDSCCVHDIDSFILIKFSLTNMRALKFPAFSHSVPIAHAGDGYIHTRNVLYRTRFLNNFRISHGNYVRKRRTHCIYEIVCSHNRGLARFQSPKGLTDFPFTEFNFNLYTDLNNFTLKSRIVAIVSYPKCALRSHQSEHKSFSRLKTVKMPWHRIPSLQVEASAKKHWAARNSTAMNDAKHLSSWGKLSRIGCQLET